MKIEKLPSGSYRVRQMVDGRTYSLTFDKPPSEKEIKKKLAQKMAENTSEKVEKGTFEHYAMKYMSIQDNVLSPSTLRSYGHMLEQLSSAFKKKQLGNITQSDVTEEINRLAADRTPKTVRNYHAFISAVFAMYRENFKLRTKLPQKVKYDKAVPVQSDVQKILDAVKGTRYYIPFRLAVYGLRQGEICAITASDLSDDNILTINKDKVLNKEKQWVIKPFPKTTSSERTIVIDNELADLIRQQGYAYDGYPTRLYQYLAETQKRLNIDRFRFHDFRAFMVTELSQAGYSEADILHMGGWATENIMKRVYRQSRIQKEMETQKEISNMLSNF